MLLINIQRARAQDNDILAEAAARRLSRKRTTSPIARLLEALRLRRAARAG